MRTPHYESSTFPWLLPPVLWLPVVEADWSGAANSGRESRLPQKRAASEAATMDDTPRSGLLTVLKPLSLPTPTRRAEINVSRGTRRIPYEKGTLSFKWPPTQKQVSK